MSQRDIVVVGGKGLLGSCLLKSYNKSHEVISVGNGIDNEKVIDVLSIQAWIQLMEEVKPRKIVNTYAYADVDGCESDVNLAYRLNSLVPAVIEAALEMCQQNIQIIHISTDQVYSGSNWYHENSDPNPLNSYGKTKLLGERYLDTNKSTILRTNFFGKSKSSKKLSYTDWIYERIKSGKETYIHQNVYFNPIHMDELVNIIKVVMEKQLTGIFNVGATTKLSKFDFAVRFAEVIGMSTMNLKASRYEQSKFKIARPTDMSVDVRKLIRASGVELMSLEKNIQLCVEEYK